MLLSMRQVVLPGASASAHHCVTRGGPPVARSAHACRARHAAPAHVFTASRTPGSATRCPRVLPSSALSSAAFATLLPPSVGELLGNATFCATALAWVLAQTLKVRWWDIFHQYLCHLRARQVFTKYVNTRSWDVRVLVRKPRDLCAVF